MSKYNLVIVDMQPEFPAAKNRNLIKNIKERIVKAIADDARIIILEYVECGETHKSITNLVKGYKKCSILTKYEDDGSKIISKSGIRLYKNMKVCGVNTSYCVFETARGLRKKYTVSVIKNCCRCEVSRNQFDKFRAFPEIKLK